MSVMSFLIVLSGNVWMDLVWMARASLQWIPNNEIYLLFDLPCKSCRALSEEKSMQSKMI